MDLQKAGIKLLIGKKTMLVSGGKAGLDLDFYGGVGLQFRHQLLTTFAGNYGRCSWNPDDIIEYDPPRREISHVYLPTLHAGILIGLPF